MMEYMGYIANVVYDESIGAIHGTVIGLRDVITFEAESVGELEQAFHDSVDDYLEFCAELGREPERSFSGKFNVRVPPDLHRLIVFRAELDNMSMNSWIVRTLASSVAKPGDTNELADWLELPRRDAEEEKEYA